VESRVPRQPDRYAALVVHLLGHQWHPLTDGNIDDPESGSFERLPTNWIADFRRLFDFGEAGRDDLRVQPAEFNITKRIDTLLGGERRNLLDINQLAPGLTISPGMVRPPEAGMQAPVSQPASSEARKTGLDSNRIPAQSRIVILNLF
jgi:hypothetical protein